MRLVAVEYSYVYALLCFAYLNHEEIQLRHNRIQLKQTLTDEKLVVEVGLAHAVYLRCAGVFCVITKL